MTDDALRPRTVGEILDGGFAIYRRHFVVLTGLGLLLFSPAMAVGALVPLLSWPLLLLVLPIHAAALIVASADALWGRSPGIVSSLRRGAARSLPLYLLWPLYFVAKLVGFTLLIVPGVLLIVLLFAWKHVVVLERGDRVLERSLQLSRGFLGKILVVVGVAGLISILPGLAIGVGDLLSGPARDTLEELNSPRAATFQVLGYLVQALTTPYLYAAVTLLYVDQRARKDGLDVERSVQAVERALEPLSEDPAL